MTVRKPPEKVNPRVDVDSLIEKGSKVKEDQRKNIKPWMIINLRISQSMLECVDDAVSKSVGITRTGWILQAIDEKLVNEYFDKE